MHSKIEVVIPIGLGNPLEGAPLPALLEEGLASIKNQSIPIILTVALDENVDGERLDIIKKYADKIRYFPVGSYFARGGIWYKIWQCWEESDAEYVAWQGYDDISGPQRFELQLEALERTHANSCFGINHSFESNWQHAGQVNDGNIDFVAHLGSHTPYMGCFLLRKSAIVASGLGEYKYKWSNYFEGLLFAFIMKTGMPCTSDGRFYFRFHRGSIAETKNPEWVDQERAKTGYTYEECIQDWNSINFEKVWGNIRKLYGK